MFEDYFHAALDAAIDHLWKRLVLLVLAAMLGCMIGVVLRGGFHEIGLWYWPLLAAPYAWLVSFGYLLADMVTLIGFLVAMRSESRLFVLTCLLLVVTTWALCAAMLLQQFD